MTCKRGTKACDPWGLNYVICSNYVKGKTHTLEYTHLLNTVSNDLHHNNMRGKRLSVFKSTDGVTIIRLG